MASVYCWFDWEDDTTTVNSISVIKEPRKPWNEYEVGEKITAKLPKYGTWRGVIVEISESKEDLVSHMNARQYPVSKDLKKAAGVTSLPPEGMRSSKKKNKMAETMVTEEKIDDSTTDEDTGIADSNRPKKKAKKTEKNKKNGEKKMDSENEKNKKEEKEKKKEMEKARLETKTREYENIISERRKAADVPGLAQPGTVEQPNKVANQSAGHSSVPVQDDPAATQYDPAATQYDPAATQYDPAATQYNPAATQYDPAATNPAATQYDPAATQYNPAATQYDPAATQYDPAATNPAATQYNPAATQYDPAATMDASVSDNSSRPNNGQNYSYTQDLRDPRIQWGNLYQPLLSYQELLEQNRDIQADNHNLRQEVQELKDRLELKSPSPSALIDLEVTPKKIEFFKRLTRTLEVSQKKSCVSSRQLFGQSSSGQQSDSSPSQMSVRKTPISTPQRNPLSSSPSQSISANMASPCSPVFERQNVTAEQPGEIEKPYHWEENVTSTGQKKVQLVGGISCYVTQAQLSHVLHVGSQPRKLVIAFLDIMFTREQLAQSSCIGARTAVNALAKTTSLPSNAVKAIKMFVLKHFKNDSGEPCMADTLFNTVINSKCATARRALKA